MKWTVGRKIVVGFGLLVVLLVAVGVVGFVALSGSSEGFTEYRRLARNANLAGRLQANMLMVRMYVKDYLVDGDESDLKHYEDYWVKTEGFMADARTQVVEPEQAKVLAESDRMMDEYYKAFQKVQKDYKGRVNLFNDVLRRRGPDAEKNLTALLHNADGAKDTHLAMHVAFALRHVLLGRLYTALFWSDKRPEYAKRTRAEFDEALKVIQEIQEDLKTPEDKALVRTVTEDLSEYRIALGKIVTLAREETDTVDNTLNKLGPVFADKIDDVKLGIKGEQDTLGPRLQASNNTAIGMIVGIGIGAVVVGTLLAGLISRGVNRSLSEIITGLQEGSDQVAATATELASAAQSLADSSGSQAAAVEETSSSLEEISSMVQTNAGNCRRAREMSESNTRSTREAKTLTDSALDLAREGNDSVTHMTDTIGKIKASSEQTAKIVKTIDEIAFQTNLLALNAAVEAARAGEAGKGFAVVAEEVRNLAQRSAEAAKNTADMIEESVRNADGGVTASEQVLESFQQISSTIEKVAVNISEVVAATEEQTQSINEVATASEEQAQGVQQINSGVSNIDDATQRNAAGAEELAASSEELSGQVEELNRMIRGLQDMVTGKGGGEAPVDRRDRGGLSFRSASTPRAGQPGVRSAAQPAGASGAASQPGFAQEASAESSEASFPLEDDKEVLSDF